MPALQCCLRDFPQPIFTSKSVELQGTLLGAEQKPADRGMFLMSYCAVLQGHVDVSFYLSI